MWGELAVVYSSGEMVCGQPYYLFTSAGCYCFMNYKSAYMMSWKESSKDRIWKVGLKWWLNQYLMSNIYCSSMLDCMSFASNLSLPISSQSRFEVHGQLHDIYWSDKCTSKVGQPAKSAEKLRAWVIFRTVFFVSHCKLSSQKPTSSQEQLEKHQQW